MDDKIFYTVKYDRENEFYVYRTYVTHGQLAFYNKCYLANDNTWKPSFLSKDYSKSRREIIARLYLVVPDVKRTREKAPLGMIDWHRTDLFVGPLTKVEDK